MFANVTEAIEGDGGTVQWLVVSSSGQMADEWSWETADPFFSAQTRQAVQTVLKCYVRQCIMFLGIPANFLSCLVFFKQGLSDRIQLLLFWLAVADLTNLAAQLFLMTACYLADTVQVVNWHVITNSKTAYATMWASFVSGTLIVVVSVDRCLYVAFPLHARRLLTYRSMVVAIALSYLVPLLMCLPAFLAFTIKWRLDPATNQSVAYTENTSWFPVDSRRAVDLIYYFPVVAKSLFFVTMIVCSVVTIHKLREASRQRGKMVGKGKEEEEEAGSNRVTKMLLFLCLVYIVLVCPEACSAIMVVVFPEYFVFKKYHNTFIIVYQFIWIASSTNSTVNFFAYLVLSSRFRRTLKELCFCFGHRLATHVE